MMGLKINGKKINKISYVYDKVVFVETETHVQRVINRINKAGLKFGMKINAGERLKS